MTIPSSPAPGESTAVFRQYATGAVPVGSFDELREPGGVRPHWQNFVDQIEALGRDQFRNRWREAQELIRENGITYNVYGDPRGFDRPWQLDPIPLLVSTAEYQKVEKGLGQRMRLFEAILADVYGDQCLLSEGLVPLELVFANPRFLRPCHRLTPAGRPFLQLVGVDLGRQTDGTLVVLGTRTQAPSGAGYALENRIVLGRMLPDVFRMCKVHRLAGFFRNLRDTLYRLAPHNRDLPRVVLLTPGPKTETYFEHAYLARYLGFTLAEGGDLTVRDQRLYLKLLDGLQPVDIVWRRLDDEFCDPLELHSDSLLGIPGLVQAVRAGHAVVANALGTGFVEVPALIPFLSRLCRHLLGEDLLIASAPTWWCGDPVSLEHVIARLPTMVIKPAFSAGREDPIFPQRLTTAQVQQLIDRLRSQPAAFVGQELLTLSTAPVLTDQDLEPRHVVMRTYIAPQRDGFEMMPGGLARVTTSLDSMDVSLKHGGGSKDTWVLSDEDVEEITLLPRVGTAASLSRAGNDLPSRAADNLFWLGRYVERAEALVRLLRGIFVRLTENAGLAEVPELNTLLEAVTHISQTAPGFAGPDAASRLAQPIPELLSVTFNAERMGSLAFDFQAIHRAALSVRDRISMDMWRILSSLASQDGDAPSLSDVLVFLNQRVLILAGFAGIASESMTRGHAWRFLDMGRKLERAGHMVDLLRWTLHHAAAWDTQLLEAILEIADSSMTYRRRYLSGAQVAPVLDLLLADPSNPRSVLFQLHALHEVIEQLPRASDRVGLDADQRIILELETSTRLLDLEPLTWANEEHERVALVHFLARLHSEFSQLSDAITHQHLSHLQVTRQLAGQALPEEGA